jgi:hypothetical protein
MKPKEFYKLMQEFVDEDKRWRALKVGDTIYEERCGGMEFEYCKMTIEEIDLDERLVTVCDTSTHIPTTKKIGDFITEKQFVLKNYRPLNDRKS